MHVRGVGRAIDAFFARSISGTALRILAEAEDPQLKEMKSQLLRMLRLEDIYVWERGAIEAYYPALEANESNKKNDRARGFCEHYTTADSIRSLPAFRDAAACEFDLVFETFFRSTLPLPNTAEIPEQAASAKDAPPATTAATG